MEGFETRRALRCGDFVQSQYYQYAKKSDNDWSVDLCCYCCNAEELLSVDETKEPFPECSGRTPLRFCKFCSNLGIKPPTTNAATNFTEKKAQRKSKKQQQREVMESM